MTKTVPTTKRHEIIPVGNQWGLGFQHEGVTLVMSYNPVSDQIVYYRITDHPSFHILFDDREDAEYTLAQVRLEGADEIFQIE